MLVLACCIFFFAFAQAGENKRRQKDSLVGVDFFWSKDAWGGSGLAIIGDGKCCGKCVETRAVFCVAVKHLRSHWIVPSKYCPSKKPSTTREVKDCGLVQKCVVSEWSEFSPCSKTCGLNAVKYRSRRILIPSRQQDLYSSDASCPPLLEKVRCLENPPCFRKNHSQYDEFTWKIDEWTNCRAIQFHYGNYGFSSFPWEKHSCGPGFKTRSVSCVNSKGQAVESRWCMLSGAKQPITSEACSMPCDCKVTQWSSWSRCDLKCRKTRTHLSPFSSVYDKEDQGIMTRTRLIVIPPQNGGLSCPILYEQRPCDEATLASLPACPHYRWFTGEWKACLPLTSEDGMIGGRNVTCGAGKQTRLVFCVEDKGEENLIPVEEKLCLPKTESNDSLITYEASARACHVPCPIHCEMGQWGSWSRCSKSCGEGGTRIRSRPILRQPSNGGDACPALSQSSPCAPVPCSWWHTGRWSKCFLRWGLESCGEGTQVRVRYCKGASNNWLPDRHCPGAVPLKQQSCTVPCPSDCVVSPWGAWSRCSKTCGTQGGVQNRTRQILASSGPNGTSCLPEEELRQSRVCNQFVKCTSSYFWQVGQWDQCVLDKDSKCGTTINGVQRRQVYCTKDPGEVLDNRFCVKALKPDSFQKCTVRCPQDCVLSPWSAWSPCSKSCSLGHKLRTRRILRLPMYAGKACPKSDEAGVITDNTTCNEKECYAYRWEMGAWSSCRTVPEVNNTKIEKSPQCGPGFQVRNVSCVRSDDRLVEAGLCLKELFTIAPVNVRRCQIACAGDCVLSLWSPWSDCSQFCGLSAGKRFRTRSVLNLNPLLGDWKQQCADVTESDLRQIAPCNQRACPSYRWHTGRWQSCIVSRPPGGYYCGSGQQLRTVLCQQTDGQFVPDEHCTQLPLPKPRSTRECGVVCPQDCAVGEWSAYTRCSRACGRGVRSRVRKVEKPTRYGGRPCPPLRETVVCEEVTCHFVHWDSEEWSACKLLNGTCGTGTRTREVKCDPFEENKRNCIIQVPEPSSQETCVIACPGDCVLSEWGQWTECSNAYPAGGVQKRERKVIRQADYTGKPCEELEQERVCNLQPPPEYEWRVGNWTSCRVGSSFGTGCGRGRQFRSRNCHRSDDVIVDPELCEKERLPSSRDCVIDCPKDCILSDWTPWSECSTDCGLNGIKRRSRRVITRNSPGGRQCPPVSHLRESTPCNSFPCITYSWHKSNWSACNVESGGCGYGLKTRSVECRRNDGMLVDFRFCYKESQGVSGGYRSMGQVVGDDMVYNIDTVQVCGTPCPGSCEMTKWGSWSPCRREIQSSQYGWVSDCNWTKGYRIRSRGIIWSETCKSLSLLPRWEKKQCTLRKTHCVTQRWRTGDWSLEGKRAVWCEENGVNITGPGACQFEEKPSENSQCIPSCKDPYTFCRAGRCICRHGFETILKDYGQICIPVTNCATNEHCPLPNTKCGNRNRCVCISGYMKTKKGYCVPAPTEAPRLTVVTTSSTRWPKPQENITNADVEVHFRENKSIADLWHWFLIGTGIILLLILLVIGFICWIQWESDRVDINPPYGTNNLPLLDKKEAGEPELVSLPRKL